MPNHATVKEIEHATGVDTSDLAAKIASDFVALKCEEDKPDINELVNVQLVWIT